MATTVQLRDRVLAHQFNSTRYADLIITWLDEAQKKLARDIKQRIFFKDYDFATAASDNSYPLPSDFSEYIGLYDQDNDDLLKPIEIRDFESIEAETGTPTYYVIIGSTIYLSPTPDTILNLRLRYYRKPLAIAADVNPEIDEDYHDLLEHYALWRAYVAEHDYEAADYHKTQWIEGKNEMKSDLQGDIFDRPRRVPNMWTGIA